MSLPPEINTLLNAFSPQSLGLNILDYIIVAVFIFYIIEGFEVGFMSALFDLISFVLSFVLGLKFYGFIGRLLTENFSIPHGFSNAIGFFIIAFVSEIVLNIILRKVYSRLKLINLDLEETQKLSLAWLKTLNRFLGILPGIFSAFILISFLLTVIISLPFSPFLKRTVSSSRLGNLFVANAQGFEKTINNVFGGALNDTLSFLTVEPQGEEIVSLKFKTTEVSIDEEAERQMLEILNKERESRGLSALSFDERLREVARSHSKDMFERGYFSHYTPNGISPFDRLAMADITYGFAGENLALAPNVILAMRGLMNSPGHKENILSPNFKKVGIGVIDGGIYGEMFSQEFTD